MPSASPMPRLLSDASAGGLQSSSLSELFRAAFEPIARDLNLQLASENREDALQAIARVGVVCASRTEFREVWRKEFWHIAEVRSITRKLMKNLASIHEQSPLFVHRTLQAEIDAVESHHGYTPGHSRRVGEYAKLIALAMGMSKEDSEKYALAGNLHDIGKIFVKSAALYKQGPAHLTRDEREFVKPHAHLGAVLLSNVTGDHLLREAALCHHEKWNGSGYPAGLKAEAIPLVARVVSVADVFDVLTSKRLYSSTEPLDLYVALRKLEEASGVCFEPRCVAALKTALTEHESRIRAIRNS